MDSECITEVIELNCVNFKVNSGRFENRGAQDYIVPFASP